MRFVAFLPAITWFIVSAVLLAIPGNDLPHNHFFDIPNFDKFVHFIMFLMLTSLFSYPFSLLTNEVLAKGWFTKITLYAIVYGILMEFVQKYLVYGRSFDVTDILFDTLGSLAGLIIIRKYYDKKIGPNRNRGRNQN
ncbi:MAG: VanZ family protein [Segetibacter sp.]|jgi:VanZ family protein|nr:VanZ family protein [Segetibacter sp.]